VRILYVEDDARMRALVAGGLTEDGHSVLAVGDAASALEKALASPFDVVVLDVMLPDRSGVDVVRDLRARGRVTPVLMLTARDTQADVVAGLDAGADDYLTKPFSFDVLLARLRALARRPPLQHAGALALGDLVLDPAAHTVRRAGAPLALTPTEFRLLECLLRRAGRVVTRQALIESLWGYERDVEANTLDAFIRLLRHKIDRAGQPSMIHTVRGIGYRLGDEAGS
jgi:two-component system, OmpR family, response regulator MprA